MKIKNLALAALLIGLSACVKSVPIEDDLSQKQAAIAATRTYVEAIESQNLDFVVEHSVFPYWLDREIVDADGLKKMLAEEAEDLANWELKQLRFYTTADIAIFAPRMIEKLSEAQIAHEYFVVAQFSDRSDKGRRLQSVLFMLQRVDGHWKIAGLED